MKTQRVRLLGEGARLCSTTTSRTDWFVVVPSQRGGGPLVITLDTVGGELLRAPSAQLLWEPRGSTAAVQATVQNGRLAWRFAAPDAAQLCRVLVRAADGDDIDVDPRIGVQQQIDPVETSGIVVAIAAADYRSKLFQITSHGTGQSRDIVRVVDGLARFIPNDHRDQLASRFLELEPGAYELRVSWPTEEDAKRLLVRPQRADYCWIDTRSHVVRDDGNIEIISAFELDEPTRVRIQFVGVGPTNLPARVTLAQRPQRAAAAANGESTDSLVLATEIRGFAATGDDGGLERILRTASDADIERALGDDAWLHNYAKNVWEFVHARSVLTAYPTDVCIPIADVCNARCTFCTSWLEGTRLASLDEVDAFEEVLRFARVVGLAGHGEPMAHPQISEILARLERWLDPRAHCYVITNGIYLQSLMADLLRSRVRSFAVSLNAASASTHQQVMGLPSGSFARILDSIRLLVSRRSADGVYVSISLVVTQQNIEEVAAFIELGQALGVDKVQLKTLAPAAGRIDGLNYQTLPPYLHPDYHRHKADVIAAIERAAVHVQADPESWDARVFPQEFEAKLHAEPIPLVSREEALRSRNLRQQWRSQEKYQEKTRGALLDERLDFDGVNPFGRAAPFACRAPVRFLYINDFSFNISPCCYLPSVPGAEPVIYDGTWSFMNAWNSDALVALRRRLREGPLFNMCTKCPTTY